MEERLYSIKEAAEALQVSKDTIRRRIKKGQIKAEKHEGPYGFAYYIKESQLAEVREIRDVVPLNRPISREQLKGVVKEAVSEEFQGLRNEIEDLRRQLEETKQLQQPAENTDKPPWWKRLFKKK